MGDNPRLFFYTDSMNAKLLEYIISYRETQGLDFSKEILSQKIKYQYQGIKKLSIGRNYIRQIQDALSTKELLLIEARAAKEYWNSIHQEYIKEKLIWAGRKPHNADVFNRLLDIGYHYLVERVVKICIKLDIPTEIGFFHIAQSKHAHPFIYDFMEWLRPIVVDRVLIKIIRKKKKQLETVDEKIIKQLVFLIKQEFERRYYNKKFSCCITLNYWIEINLLHFVHFVYKKESPNFYFPSMRNENRCKTKPSN